MAIVFRGADIPHSPPQPPDAPPPPQRPGGTPPTAPLGVVRYPAVAPSPCQPLANCHNRQSTPLTAQC